MKEISKQLKRELEIQASAEANKQHIFEFESYCFFKFNPTVSFLVACNTKEEVAAMWRELSEGGSALMELGEYPFSEKYG